MLPILLSDDTYYFESLRLLHAGFSVNAEQQQLKMLLSILVTIPIIVIHWKSQTLYAVCCCFMLFYVVVVVVFFVAEQRQLKMLLSILLTVPIIHWKPPSFACCIFCQRRWIAAVKDAVVHYTDRADDSVHSPSSRRFHLILRPMFGRMLAWQWRVLCVGILF